MEDGSGGGQVVRGRWAGGGAAGGPWLCRRRPSAAPKPTIRARGVPKLVGLLGFRPMGPRGLSVVFGLPALSGVAFKATLKNILKSLFLTKTLIFFLNDFKKSLYLRSDDS